MSLPFYNMIKLDNMSLYNMTLCKCTLQELQKSPFNSFKTGEHFKE